MANDIKQRIVLEGEKEYAAAIKEAKRNLSVLKSELKAETAELGKNATAQEKNAVKVKNLKQQIAEQEKVVKTYEDALKEVKEKYGDNEEAIAKWEVKLNDARTALANMKNGLTETDGGIKQTTTDMNTGVTAANSLADSFSKIGEIGASVAGSIEGIFTSIIGTISKSVQAVWAELIDVAAKSDNYLDLAAYFGSSATEVQKWDSAMKSANGSLDTVTSLITKLKYSGKNQEIATWFGISDENYTNDLQYFQVVMQRMFEMRDEMVKAGTWDTAMTAIFGNKKGEDVEGILSDWDDILAGLDKFNADEGGFGLSEDQINKMAELSVQVATLKESWEKLKEMATVELFGNLALNITGNLQNIVDAFKDYFQAENDSEREAAIQKIKENIIEMFQHIKEAINEGIQLLNELATELKESGDPTAQLLGEVLGSIVSALQWFADPANWGAVQTAFEALIGIWATGKIVSALANMASFGSHIATIGNFFGWGNNGTNTSAPTVQPTTGGGGGFLTGLGDRLGLGFGGSSIFKLAGGLGVAGYIGAQMIQANLNDANLNAIYGDNSGKGGLVENMSSDIAQAVGDYFKLYQSSYGSEGAMNARESLYNLLEAEGYANAEQGVSLIENIFDNLLKENNIDGLLEELNATFADFGLEDLELPAEWWQNPSGAGNENDITSDDLRTFNSLPEQVRTAVQQGAQAGVSGIKVLLDGQTVGNLVAGYVSERVAASMLLN